jgi:hypothetical protein
MPALDLSLRHGMIGLAAGVRHALAIEPIGQVSGKIGWTIVAEQAWPLIAVDLIEPRVPVNPPLLRDQRSEPAAAPEARRQVVALVEILARPAAGEDDAAEAAEEHSRSPPDVLAEQSPPRCAKEANTS